MVLLIIHDPCNAMIPSIISRHQLNTHLFPLMFWYLLNLNIPSPIDWTWAHHTRKTPATAWPPRQLRDTHLWFFHSVPSKSSGKQDIGLLPDNWDLPRENTTTPNPSTMQQYTQGSGEETDQDKGEWFTQAERKTRQLEAQTELGGLLWIV